MQTKQPQARHPAEFSKRPVRGCRGVVGWRSLAQAGLSGAVVLWVVLLTALVPVAAGEGCPNEQARTENGSVGLPDCRAYELVSPTGKNGGQAGALQESARYAVARADGEAVAYSNGGGVGFGSTSTGFDEWSVSRRSPGSWGTSAALPRGEGNLGVTIDEVHEFNSSSDFSRFFFKAPGPFVSAPDGEGDPNMFLAGEDPFVEPEWVGRPAIANPAPALGRAAGSGGDNLAGGSPAFNPIYFTYDGTLTAEDEPRQNNEIFQNELKEHPRSQFSENMWGFYVREGSALHSAGVLPDGVTSPFGAVPAATDHAEYNEFTSDDFDNQVSVDGSRAFFVSPDPHARVLCEAAHFVGPGGCVPELYVRERSAGGVWSTVLVSRDEGGGTAVDGPLGLVALDPCGVHCTSFVFGSPDGSQAFFESTDSLATGAPVNGLPKMYDFDVNRGVVHYLPEVTGEAPVALGRPEEDESRVLVSSVDGSRFLFEKIEDGRPVGLGLWSTGEHQSVKMITPLPGPERTTGTNGGEVHVRPARTTADGSVFAFETDSPIQPEEGSFNNGGGFEQVYHYAVGSGGSPGVLSCVSCPPAGVMPSGDARLSEDDNQGGSDQAVGEGSLAGSRGLSADGSEVFFDSPDPLVPQDTNSKRDIYMWENGNMHLISSGRGGNESFFLDNSEDGQDVFFATTDNLVEDDTDGGYDVYDARVNGGFSRPSIPAGCLEDACQGPLGAPSGLPVVSGTATFTGGMNAGPPPVKSVVKHTTKKKQIRKKRRGKKARKSRHGGRVDGKRTRS